MKSLSLVVPARNSCHVIKPFLRGYYKVFSEKFFPFELIVVCNGCTDNTKDICSSLTSEFPLKVMDIPKKGKGRALVAGFNIARNEILGFLDADNPFNLDEVKKMIDLLESYDVVIASKYKKGRARSQDSQFRRLISLGGAVVSLTLFNLRLTDTQAGAKFFRRRVWDSIDRDFICHNFDFDIEFLYKVGKKGFSIREFYIPFQYRKFSTVSLRYLPGMLKRLLMLRLLK
ncbi:MAG TPA: glycosyltransferase family 2 protein [Candidatus Pacearchaeota archaeon]|nr:glycosyltransferase family 2 protein [Candidatus Pacearchaeota archaeon]